ncbi:hypothetical protein [Synechococcus sp. UW140]|uniref:hypothetical protein n=1 Tax=Synechococcus sp. UW140 TaxID=368503 RepID=UPI000E0FC3F3|nr:hypothetical protein [Synechococcus sp. UW140]
MAKELTHRADELQALGWSADEVARYAELWDYRQRWGAMNLEREDRLFLRKAEAALPAIVTGKAAAKKNIREKSYYLWLQFHLDAMTAAEQGFGLSEGARGAWAMLLEEELRLLDYYQPVLGLPDTLKAKGFDAVRAEMAADAVSLAADGGSMQQYDFKAALDTLKATETSRWRHLLDQDGAQPYPVLDGPTAASFRQQVRSRFVPLVRQTLPSLAETDKPEPADEWSCAVDADS